MTTRQQADGLRADEVHQPARDSHGRPLTGGRDNQKEIRFQQSGKGQNKVKRETTEPQ